MKKKINSIILGGSSGIGREVYNELNKISRNIFKCSSKDIDTYDQNLNAGDIMIFDEHGVHRASKPSLNDRYVLRFVYSRKNFKNLTFVK